MPSLDEMLAGQEAASDSSSPEGQRRIQSEILSLQQEARLKKQQLAEVAASVQQVRLDHDSLQLCTSCVSNYNFKLSNVPSSLY